MLSPTLKLPDDRLVIAVDFGTTYSGVAYAFNVPGKKADVTSILDWPGESVSFPRTCLNSRCMLSLSTTHVHHSYATTSSGRCTT